MLIYFVSTALIGLFGVGFRANLNNKRRKIFLILSFGLLILVAGLRAPSVGIDLSRHYALRYEQIASYSWAQIPKYAEWTTYEIGYCYFCKFLSLINPNVQFFIFFTSALVYSIIGLFIYKKSTNVVMSTLLFVFSCQYFMYMNIIRQAIAVAIILLAYLKLDDSKRTLLSYIGFAACVLLATTFHTSAFLCMIIILLDHLRFQKKNIAIGLVVTLVLYVFYEQIYSVISKTFLSGEYENYLTSSTEGVGNINLQSLVNFLLTLGAYLLGMYILVWKKRGEKQVNGLHENSLSKYESMLLYMCLFGAISRLLIFRMNIINRFSYYFLPFLLLLYPYAISQIRMRSNRIFVKSIVYLAFAIYFVCMTVYYANAFYGTVPYSFYWQ